MLKGYGVLDIYQQMLINIIDFGRKEKNVGWSYVIIWLKEDFMVYASDCQTSLNCHLDHILSPHKNFFFPSTSSDVLCQQREEEEENHYLEHGFMSYVPRQTEFSVPVLC